MKGGLEGANIGVVEMECDYQGTILHQSNVHSVTQNNIASQHVLVPGP